MVNSKNLVLRIGFGYQKRKTRLKNRGFSYRQCGILIENEFCAYCASCLDSYFRYLSLSLILFPPIPLSAMRKTRKTQLAMKSCVFERICGILDGSFAHPRNERDAQNYPNRGYQIRQHTRQQRPDAGNRPMRSSKHYDTMTHDIARKTTI
jgi:hypothetical protein